VVLSVRREGPAVRFTVTDTGIGIAPLDLPRIFERFYKVDQSRASIGSGLGLAVVKHTVEAHGGTVRAESGPGAGSTFTITLPLKPVPPA
jgi:signal transduction histidine kinase